MKYEGIVEWFNPKSGYGYGFISWSKDGVAQEDMFAHYSDLLMEGFKTLKKGQVVEFEIGENKHGKPKAVNIKILNG